MQDSVKIEKEISAAKSTPEKVKVKYEIIDEMNCRINNFSNDTICVKQLP